MAWMPLGGTLLPKHLWAELVGSKDPCVYMDSTYIEKTQNRRKLVRDGSHQLSLLLLHISIH